MFALKSLKEMNVAEARRLTEAAKAKRNDLPGLVAYAIEKIRTAAKSGGTRVEDPLTGIRCRVTSEQRAAVFQELVSRGFTVYRNGVCWDEPAKAKGGRKGERHA